MDPSNDTAAISYSQFFGVSRRQGILRGLDSQSGYLDHQPPEHLTFDVGNNCVLANVSPMGSIARMTVYRGSYRDACHPAGWSGVWAAKDSSCRGPYSFRLETEGSVHDLSQVNWDFDTRLQDGVFPVTKLTNDAGDLEVTLSTWVPLSRDGSLRPQGLLHVCSVSNLGPARIKAVLHLPQHFPRFSERAGQDWADYDPFDFEFGMADGSALRETFALDLEAGERREVALVIYMPGSTALDQIASRGLEVWREETRGYFQDLGHRLGRFQDEWTTEWAFRQALQVFLAVAMTGEGDMAGSNWGSYPSTRHIWTKDCYHSVRPLLTLTPDLALPIVKWFHRFSVRHPGTIVQGGVNHSISLTVSALILANDAIENQTVVEWMRSHPTLRQEWEDLLNQLISSRQDPEVSLFPTRFLSDGRLEGDWHTGSNICVWLGFVSFERLLQVVWSDPSGAIKWSLAASETRRAILARLLVKGPHGPYFAEAVNRDGTVPHQVADGEESETTLIPVYGFLPPTDEWYLNTMRFAVSDDNRIWNPAVGGISWSQPPESPLSERVPATAPGYAKSLVHDREKGMAELRRLTDVDGSLWWWPYGDRPVAGPEALIRGVPGKSGWASGVLLELLQLERNGQSHE